MTITIQDQVDFKDQDVMIKNKTLSNFEGIMAKILSSTAKKLLWI